MTVATSPRDCSCCSWGDRVTRHQGVGVPAGSSGIGGELTIPVTMVHCQRHGEDMDPSDSCSHWTYDKNEE